MGNKIRRFSAFRLKVRVFLHFEIFLSRSQKIFNFLLIEIIFFRFTAATFPVLEEMWVLRPPSERWGRRGWGVQK